MFSLRKCIHFLLAPSVHVIYNPTQPMLNKIRNFYASRTKCMPLLRAICSYVAKQACITSVEKKLYCNTSIKFHIAIFK